MNFTINRATWRCGGAFPRGENVKGKGRVSLLNEEGYQCCLGQVASQLGIPDEKMLGCSVPSAVEDLRGTILCSGPDNSRITNSAVYINDNERLTDQQREDALQNLFRKHGHKIEFTGEYES